MHDFVLRELKNTDIKNELEKIGFDKSYVHKAYEKFEYKNIKIYSLSPAQANIIKQTALSVGADCATHRDVITGKVETSNCILGGSVSQIKKIAEKLQFQPFGLKELGEKLGQKIEMCHCEEGNGLPTEAIQPINSDLDKNTELLRFARNDGLKNLSTIQLFNRSTNDNHTSIVGILNLTENSFSDGGMYNNFESAKNRLVEMIDEGADIIDIGAESTKPYSTPVCDEEQLKKLLPIIEFAKDKINLSIDTRSAKVAKKCLEAGAYMINDVSGFDYDENMVDVIAKYNCPIVIQHSKGNPKNMQDNPQYDDVTEEIFLDLYKKCEKAKSKGIENIIIDVGIGFGKTREHNFELIRRIDEFKGLGYPVMLGISRKSFLNLDNNEDRDIYTTALNALAIERKVNFLRVHNVKMHKTLIDLMKMFMVK